MRAILGATVQGATIVELVLAFATGSALWMLVGTFANRIFLSGPFGMQPTSQWLGPSLFVFVVCAGLLAAAIYLRLRAEGVFAATGAPGDDE